MKSIDRIVRARKAVKADRATEQGIAGHQAASKALGNAANWTKLNIFGTDLAISTRPGSILDAPYTHTFIPGEVNVGVDRYKLRDRDADRSKKPLIPLTKDIDNGS